MRDNIVAPSTPTLLRSGLLGGGLLCRLVAADHDLVFEGHDPAMAAANTDDGRSAIVGLGGATAPSHARC